MQADSILSGPTIFSAQALDLARAIGEELRVARFLLNTASDKAGIQLQPVLTAVDIILDSPQATPSERTAAIGLRDRLIEAAPQRHFFRAQLARRERDLDTAMAEISAHLGLYPSDISALVLRASIAMQTGRWGKYASEILALAAIEGNERSAELLDLFQRFQAAQGFSPDAADDIALHHERLETPGAVYEYAMDRAPAPDTSARKGVVLLTGSLAGGGAERIVATMFRQFRTMEPDEDLQLWLFPRPTAPPATPCFICR